MATTDVVPPIAPSGTGLTPAVRARAFANWAIRSLLHRKLSFIVGFLASAGVAVPVSGLLAKRTWESTGILLYTPLSMNESQASMYVPPDLKTLVSIAKEPSAIEKMRNEFHLGIPTTTLEALFEVNAPNNTKTIDFKLKWAEAKVGADMVNRLMEVLRKNVLDIRLRKIADYVKDSEGIYEKTSKHHEVVTQEFQEVNRRASSVDIGRELNLMNDGLVVLHSEMGKARRGELNYKSQANELERVIAELKAKDRKESETQTDASAETLADSQRRTSRLRELIQEEKSKRENEALLTAKRSEYKSLGKLAAQNYVSRADMEKVVAEMGVLVAKIEDSDQIKAWKKEIARLDEVMVPKGKTNTQGSPIIQQMLTKRLELDLILLGNREEVRQIDEEIKAKGRRIDQLLNLQSKHHALQKDVEAAELEKQTAAMALFQMRKLQAMRVEELVVVTSAVTAPYQASNRKLLLPALLAAGLFLTASSVLGFERLTSKGPTAAAVVADLGLPLLETFEGLSPEVASLAGPDLSVSIRLRLLALRLRQAIRTSSGLCLFSTLNESAGSAWLVVPLACCLARRDERVLIVDAAGHPDDFRSLKSLLDPLELPEDDSGLADFLSFAKIDPEEVILPTTLAAVDCLLRGTTPVGIDLLATHRMSELIDVLRSRYTIILVMGPRADYQVDLELLTSRADGVVFLADDRAGSCITPRSSITALAALGAVILGAVVGRASRLVSNRGPGAFFSTGRVNGLKA